MRTLCIMLLIVATSLPSCATLFSGSSDKVEFRGPPGTTVYADGELIGSAPCSGKIRRYWGSGDIEFMRGNRVCRHRAPRVVDGWLAGDIAMDLFITWGLSSIIDVATGNVRKTPSDTTIRCTFDGRCDGEEVAKSESEAGIRLAKNKKVAAPKSTERRGVSFARSSEPGW